MAKKISISNDKAVVAAIAKEIDRDPEELEIRDAHYKDFTGKTYKEITIGSEEYFVAQNEDSAYDLAIAMVKQDLESEPEVFNKDFIESHIDTDRLRRDLMNDVQNMNYEQLKDEDPDMDDAEAERLAIEQAEDQLKDPMSYLEDIYGREDAVAQAIKIAGIDVNAAAKEAVGTDGIGHFLSPYDGELHDADGGLVYWRHN